MKPGKAIVVGASSGIGRELVRQMAQAGWKVAAVARRGDRLQELVAEFPDRVLLAVHDVREIDQVPELFQELCRQLGGLDLLVYSSGVMNEVGLQEYSLEKDRPMIDVNVTGAVAWINEAATRFQGTRHGSILGIGSVAGDRGRKGTPVYAATKSFLHTYLEALRNRLHRYGVTVTTIKPGPVDTEMTARLRLRRTMPVEHAARVILSRLGRQGEFYLSPIHGLAFYVLKRLPGSVFRRLGL